MAFLLSTPRCSSLTCWRRVLRVGRRLLRIGSCLLLLNGAGVDRDVFRNEGEHGLGAVVDIRGAAAVYPVLEYGDVGRHVARHQAQVPQRSPHAALHSMTPCSAAQRPLK